MSNQEQNQVAEAAAPEVTFEQLREIALELAQRNRELIALITGLLLSAGPRLELPIELEPEISKHSFQIVWLEDGKGVAVELVKLSELDAEPTEEAPEPDEPAA